MKREKIFLISFLLFFTCNAFSQTAATVINLKKNRTGERFSNQWTIHTDSPNQIWRTGPTKKLTRKSFVKAGASDLLVGVGPTPGSINQMLNGTRLTEWTTLKAGTSRDFGNPSELVILSTGPGEFYVHVEWFRKHTSILGF